jgi:hypothetical protein
VLPIGGFTGTNPSPTLAHLRALIAQRDLAVIKGLPIPILVCGPAG